MAVDMSNDGARTLRRTGKDHAEPLVELVKIPAFLSLPSVDGQDSVRESSPFERHRPNRQNSMTSQHSSISAAWLEDKLWGLISEDSVMSTSQRSVKSSQSQSRGFRSTGFPLTSKPTAILTWNPGNWQSGASVATTQQQLLLQKKLREEEAERQRLLKEVEETRTASSSSSFLPSLGGGQNRWGGRKPRPGTIIYGGRLQQPDAAAARRNLQRKEKAPPRGRPLQESTSLPSIGSRPPMSKAPSTASRSNADELGLRLPPSKERACSAAGCEGSTRRRPSWAPNAEVHMISPLSQDGEERERRGSADGTPGSRQREGSTSRKGSQAAFLSVPSTGAGPQRRVSFASSAGSGGMSKASSLASNASGRSSRRSTCAAVMMESNQQGAAKNQAQKEEEKQEPEDSDEESEESSSQEDADDDDEDETGGWLKLQGPARRKATFTPTLHLCGRDPKMRRVIFSHLHSDGLIARDQLPFALRLFGYKEVNVEQVEQAAVKVIGHISCVLDYNDFSTVIDLYDEALVEKLSEEFKQADLDSSGYITASEIFVLLRRAGITPLPGVVPELLEELKGSKDAELNMADFVELHAILSEREGFTKREADSLRILFDRYDKDLNGTMSVFELETAMRWKWYPVQEDVDAHLRKLMDGADTLDKGGEKELTVRGFLQVMRRHQEFEVDMLAQIFDPQPKDVYGRISNETAMKLFQQLGYSFVTAEVVEESHVGAAKEEEKGADGAEAGFYLEGLYMALDKIREREGFLMKEIEEFQQAFQRFDKDKTGSIGVLELGGIMRWLGYSSTVDEQQDLMDEIDIDKSGELEFNEFLKFMRRIREDEVMRLRRVFSWEDNDGDGRLSAEELRSVFLVLGYPRMSASQEEQFKEEYGPAGPEFAQFVEFIAHFRHSAREEFRKNQGFTHKELLKLRTTFQNLDHDDSGVIDGKELRELLAIAFPDTSQSALGRSSIMNILKSADSNGDMCIEWQEFLTIMRISQDRQDYARVRKVQKAAQQSAFNTKEVSDLRKIFNIYASESSHDIQLHEIGKIFSTMMKVSPAVAASVRVLQQEVVKVGRQTMDFAEFLLLMQQTRDMGALPPEVGVNSSTTHQHHEEEEPEKDPVEVAHQLGSQLGSKIKALRRSQTVAVWRDGYWQIGGPEPESPTLEEEEGDADEANAADDHSEGDGHYDSHDGGGESLEVHVVDAEGNEGERRMSRKLSLTSSISNALAGDLSWVQAARTGSPGAAAHGHDGGEPGSAGGSRRNSKAPPSPRGPGSLSSPRRPSSPVLKSHSSGHHQPPPAASSKPGPVVLRASSKAPILAAAPSTASATHAAEAGPRQEAA